MMIDFALSYIESGFKVFPVKPDKTPYTTHGLKDATQIKSTAKSYWNKWPDAGIGLVTDGFAVLDFDVKNGGLESKQAIIQKFGELPPTRVHRTGGGGEHWLYKQTDKIIRNTTNALGFPGVDIRGTGGYIVAPPSTHSSGNTYQVLHSLPIADAPEWLTTPRRSMPLQDHVPDQPIPQSTRNDTLTRNAGAMRRRGLSESAIVAALLVQNQEQCSPPLSENEVRLIAHSVGNYPPDELDSLPVEETEQTEQTEHCEQSENHEEALNNTERSVLPKRDKIVWRLVDEWLEYHKGETFDLDTICRQLVLNTREDRQSVAKKLFYDVDHQKLEKPSHARARYAYLDKTFISIDWLNGTEDGTLPFHWPMGRGDVGNATHFSFADNVEISSGDLIVVAGVSNMGKTGFCLNALWDNMDLMPSTLMGNEYEPGKFRRRVSNMTWANPVGIDGKPKFELIKRFDGWKDIIRPDNLNIIDWINLGDNFYQIGTILEGIQSKLRKGIALVSIQKDAHKELGLGGGFSQHLASVYLSIDFERVTVVKAKSWKGTNPNGKVYGFSLTDAGTKFSNIRELKKCKSCGGLGKSRGSDCENCMGKGWVDAV